jgi:granule-bound starch synthase
VKICTYWYYNFQVMDAKPLLKEALQAEVGLPVDRNIPLIGFIGRLEEQKGSDILAAAIPKFIGEDVQIVVLVSIHSKLFSCKS